MHNQAGKPLNPAAALDGGHSFAPLHGEQDESAECATAGCRGSIASSPSQGLKVSMIKQRMPYLDVSSRAGEGLCVPAHWYSYMRVHMS